MKAECNWIEIGETGKQMHVHEFDGCNYVKPEKIYQCEKCKTIKITYDN